MIHTDLFERFINMLINDATYSTDEGLSNMQKAQEMKAKGDPATYSQADFQSYDRLIGSSAHFNR